METRNPVKEIEEALPELNTISNYGNVEYLSRQSWHNRLKAISTKNLKTYKRCLCDYALYFYPCIISYASEDGAVAINIKKYKLIREYLLSSVFNKNFDTEEK